MKSVFCLLIVGTLLLFPQKVFAALFINEFSSGTSDSDWIEIFNSDNAPVDLSNYILRDSTSSNKLSLSGEISANGFTTFDWSNKLNNDGDTIRLLLKSDESSIDQIIYGTSGNVSAPSGTQTAGRSPDGSQNIVILSSSSKGLSNNTATAIPTATLTPTETPTPTKEPTPTKTPTPSPTSKPTATNTPDPTQKPTVTNAPTEIPNSISTGEDDLTDLSPEVTSVLGTEDAYFATPSSVTPTKIIHATKKSNNPLPWILIGSGIICFIAAGIGAVWLKKKGLWHESDSTHNDFS